MKRILAILTAVMLLVAVMATAEGFLQTENPAEELTVEQKLYKMIPVLDSFARAIGVEGEIPYDAEEPQFVWTQLYLASVNWGALNPEIRVEGSEMIVPADAMLEIAKASFSGMEELPELGENIWNIRYDLMAQTYALDLSDIGDTYIVIERYAEDADGNLHVGVGLFNPEGPVRLGGFTVVLTEASTEALDAAAVVEEPAFPYEVLSAGVEQETDFADLDVTLCEIVYVAEIEEDPTLPVITAAPTATPAVTAKPTATPAQYSKLSVGSKGDAVRALQKRLNELGYNSGSVDGVFGNATKDAVRYFQDAIGVNQDGVATSTVQEKLFSSNAPKFVNYVQLKKGSAGIRVEKLQARLRELGYLAAPVDGEFGSRTEDAVKLFQKQADLKVDGIAGEKTLKAIFSKKAEKCDTYIALQKGDTGPRVKEMQERLYKLGFASKKANGTYDSNTVKAVKAFLDEIDETGNGKNAGKDLLKKLFKYEPATPTPAPTADPTQAPTTEPTSTPTTEPTSTPTAEPTSTPTAEPSPTPTATAPETAITHEELEAFRLAVNEALSVDYDAAQAVTWLQTQLLMELPNGVYDEATMAAVKEVQTTASLEPTGIADAAVIALLIP